MCIRDRRATTASYQPHLRARPVVTPYSPPVLRSHSPVSSRSSVGNGPSPTRIDRVVGVIKAYTTRVGPTPEPVQAPPAVALDDVTKGYVPWSTSSMVA